MDKVEIKIPNYILVCTPLAQQKTLLFHLEIFFYTHKGWSMTKNIENDEIIIKFDTNTYKAFLMEFAKSPVLIMHDPLERVFSTLEAEKFLKKISNQHYRAVIINS